MSEVIAEILKPIIEKIKSSKLIWLFVVGYILFLLKIKYPLEYEVVLKNVEITLTNFYKDPLPTVFVILILLIVLSIMKLSDTKCQESYRERELRFEIFKSKDQKPFKVTVLENTRLLFNEKPYREIKIFNNSGEYLNKASGQIDFYRSKVRAFSIEFEIAELKDGYGHYITKMEINKLRYEWDEFDLLVKYANFENTELSKSRFHGIRFSILPPDLKKITNRKWLEKFIPYNLDWLKDIINWRVIPYIKSYFRTQTIYEKKPSSVTTRNIIINYTRIILTAPFIIGAIGFSLYVIGRCILLWYRIFHIWGVYFVDLIRKLIY